MQLKNQKAGLLKMASQIALVFLPGMASALYRGIFGFSASLAAELRGKPINSGISQENHEITLDKKTGRAIILACRLETGTTNENFKN